MKVIMAVEPTSSVRDVEEITASLQQLTAEEVNPAVSVWVGIIWRTQAAVSRELEELLEQQTQLDMRMAVFQHML